MKFTVVPNTGISRVLSARTLVRHATLAFGLWCVAGGPLTTALQVENVAQAADEQERRQLKLRDIDQSAQMSEEYAKLAEEKRKKAEALRLAEQQKKAEVAAQRKAKQDEAAEKMNKELDQFSVTLNKKHFDAAMQIRDDAESAGLEDIPIKVHAGDIYKKSFTFPQIAHNDFAVEQFEALSIAEANLNNDP